MKKISKYKVCGLLGRGSMGKVYKVELPVIGKIAALKLLDPNPLLVDLMGAETIRTIFVSEAITMAGLRHPNIVEIWDFDETEDKLFYTMDYYCNNLGIVMGEKYRADRPSRIMKMDKAIHYTRQTLAGIDCLHYAGIIHRDIKPYNILLTDHDTVKICDFGLSKLRGERFTGPPNLKVGSPFYAAPEQEEDPDKVDFSADLYSVGVMLYRMLTGNLPTERSNTPSKFNPDLYETWDLFLKKTIDTNSQNRFATAKEMLGALENRYTEWKRKKEEICDPSESLLSISGKQESTSVPERVKLRNYSLKVDSRQGKKIFATDDLWRPSRYVQNDFKTKNDSIVEDRRTGLVWQQAGTDYPITWRQAHLYIEKLNDIQFAGHGNWRLPTVDELMSILTKTPHGEDYCIESLFDNRQKWLWSSDRRTYTSAWYVSFEMGFVGWHDFSGYCHVKAVCVK